MWRCSRHRSGHGQHTTGLTPAASSARGSAGEASTAWQASGMDIEVVDVPDKHRFEARTTDGTVAGFSVYRLDGARVIFVHTEVDDEFEGMGVGSQLVREALDQLRDRGRSVRPDCPFVRAWIDRHPAYGVLVTP